MAVTKRDKRQSTIGPAVSGAGDSELRSAAFQEFLDERFPIGAMCAVLTRTSNHLDETASVATGRLVGGAVEQDDSGRWWHELVIDSRGSENEAEVVNLWVSMPRPHGDGANLWESEVRTDSGEGILRLNADPPEPWRPTVQMRKEITEAYADRLSVPERSQ